MYTIRVNVDTIDYKSIIKYYNTKKSNNEEELNVLERLEGGFKITLRNYNHPIIGENNKIRKLIWDNRCLVNYSLLNMFTERQLDLLFESIENSIGKNNVKKIEFINNGAFSYIIPKKCNYKLI